MQFELQGVRVRVRQLHLRTVRQASRRQFGGLVEEMRRIPVLIVGQEADRLTRPFVVADQFDGWK